MKILIIDDKEENLYFLESLLKASGYNVITAVNGKDALDKLHNDSIEMIISDILMPEMDGFQLLKHVKDDNKLKDIPFVFYTATYVDKKDMEFGLKLGAVEYIKKPTDPEVFLATIHGIIRDVDSGKLKPKKPSLVENKEIFKLYSSRLIQKLEKKMLDLEKEVTERKRIEAALKERMKELRFLYSTTEIAGRPKITLDEIYRESVNQIPPGWQYPEITGGCITIDGKVYKTRNFKETKWMQREDIHVRAEIIGTIEVCYLQEKPDEYEGPFLKEESELIKNFSKQLGGHIARIQDEEALRSSEERLKLIFENAPDAIYLVDLKGTFIDGNKTAEDLMGYKKEELIGKSFLKLKLLSTKELLKASKLLMKSVKGKGTGPDEFLLNRKDSSQVPVEISTYPMKIKNKIVVLGIARDITERKQSEIKLRESEERFRKLFDSAHDALMTLNPPTWKFTSGNPSIMNMFKVKNVKEFLTYGPWDISPEKQPDGRLSSEKAKEMIDIAMTKGSNYFEWTHKRINGESFPATVLLTKIQLKDETFLQATVRDITKRKKIEEDLIKYQQHLEELVEERTAKLETANKELKAFSYSVSHDLRAPLRAIDGFTDILMEEYVSKLDEEGKRLGNNIQDNAKKMGRLIDDLLAFSRVGRASMTSTKIDMKNMVKAMYHEATSVDERKRIKFNLAELVPIEGDPNLMRQVWMNLISNAIKFSSQRKQAVISVTSKEEKNKVTYCIKDNGAGFNMKYVDKLFSVFQRLHSETDLRVLA